MGWYKEEWASEWLKCENTCPWQGSPPFKEQSFLLGYVETKRDRATRHGSVTGLSDAMVYVVSSGDSQCVGGLHGRKIGVYIPEVGAGVEGKTQGSLSLLNVRQHFDFCQVLERNEVKSRTISSKTTVRLSSEICQGSTSQLRQEISGLPEASCLGPAGWLLRINCNRVLLCSPRGLPNPHRPLLGVPEEARGQPCWRPAGNLFESAGRLGEEGFWVFSR